MLNRKRGVDNPWLRDRKTGRQEQVLWNRERGGDNQGGETARQGDRSSYCGTAREEEIIHG